LESAKCAALVSECFHERPQNRRSISELDLGFTIAAKHGTPRPYDIVEFARAAVKDWEELALALPSRYKVNGLTSSKSTDWAKSRNRASSAIVASALVARVVGNSIDRLNFLLFNAHFYLLDGWYLAMAGHLGLRSSVRKVHRREE
jgi:hypothetical protein